MLGSWRTRDACTWELGGGIEGLRLGWLLDNCLQTEAAFKHNIENERERERYIYIYTYTVA